MSTYSTTYFDEALLDLSCMVNSCVDYLTSEAIEFDTMVGTGMSGAIIIPMLATTMGKKFVLIRKDDDDSHHGGGRLLGEMGERWMFVDDFVSSGKTQHRVVRKIGDVMADRLHHFDIPVPEFVGSFLYRRLATGRTPFKPKDDVMEDVVWWDRRYGIRDSDTQIPEAVLNEINAFPTVNMSYAADGGTWPTASVPPMQALLKQANRIFAQGMNIQPEYMPKIEGSITGRLSQ